MMSHAYIKRRWKLLMIVASIVLGTAVIVLQRTSYDLNDGRTIIVAAHMDDELLWFEPLLLEAHSIVQAAMPIGPAQMRSRNSAYRDYKGSDLRGKIVHAFPPIGENEAFFQAVVGPAIDPDVSKRCLRDRRYGLARTKAALEPILRRAVAQGATRIVTHNPWGEYGHPQHRMLGRAVRELAVEQLHVDVWVLATVVTAEKPRRYVDIGDMPGVAYARLAFDAENLRKTREEFKKQIFFNTSIDTWTWDEGENDFPTGERAYVRLVVRDADNGAQDLTKSNPELAQRIQDLTGGLSEPGGTVKATLLYQDCTAR